MCHESVLIYFLFFFRIVIDMSITEEFYNKFPSFNNNSKEFKRNEQTARYQAEFMKRAREDIKLKQNQTIKKKNSNNVRHCIIDNSSNNKNVTIFSSEERNLKEAVACNEKKINYRKLLLQQIEDEKRKKELLVADDLKREKIIEE